MFFNWDSVVSTKRFSSSGSSAGKMPLICGLPGWPSKSKQILPPHLTHLFPTPNIEASLYTPFTLLLLKAIRFASLFFYRIKIALRPVCMAKIITSICATFTFLSVIILILPQVLALRKTKSISLDILSIALHIINTPLPPRSPSTLFLCTFLVLFVLYMAIRMIQACCLHTPLPLWNCDPFTLSPTQPA